jgi:hypothetical protein
MKTYLLSALAALIGFLLVIACEATMKVQGSENTPIIGDAFVDFTIKAGPPATIEANPTDTVAPGTCLKLTFVDAKGNVIGSAEATTGGDPVPVPPGAEDVVVSPCDPKPDPDKKSDKAKRPGIFGREELAGGGALFFYRSMPLNALDGSARFVDFTVRARDHFLADVIAFDFLAGGVFKAKPSEVETYGFVHAEATGSGQVCFVLASSSKPTGLVFDWNGRQIATLKDAHRFRSAGWYLSAVHVPGSMVDVLRSANDFAYKLATVDGEIASASSVAVKR